jgi:hypothetical protein
VGSAVGAASRSEPSSPGRAPSHSQPESGAHHSSDPLATLGRHVPLPIPVPDWSKPIILALLVLAIWLGLRSRLAVSRARRLENQRVALLQDLGVMQAALVPAVPPRLEGLAVSVAYRPADGPAAGGDFYDLFITQAGRVAIILGDVSGHGREALTQAALTRYTLRAYLQAGLEPRAALALAGQALADPAIEHYATVAVGIYDSQRGLLTYSLAGHPPPILRGVQAPEPLTICSSPPVGWCTPTGRRQSTISLASGSEVCFFSDGLIEARSPDGLLGRTRLGEILGGLGPMPAATDLLAGVRAAAPQAPDDMAACILSPISTVEIPPMHLEELEVDAGALKGDSVERFLNACELSPAQVFQTIESAGGIAAADRTALIRVALGPDGSAALVEPVSLNTSQGALHDRSPTRQALLPAQP